MAKALRELLIEARAGPEAVRDVCFSGNGEPTVSRHFPAALEAAARIRAELVPGAALVVITNGTGLLNRAVFECLRRAATGPEALDVWLKLDAGTGDWYARMARSAVPFDRLVAAIKAFARVAPVTIQTMLCAVQGAAPPRAEAAAWEGLVLELAASGGLTGVQIYGKARPSPGDPLASPLPPPVLEERAAALRAALHAAGPGGPGGAPVPVDVFL
jgi:histidinol dehydrogenase